MDTTGQFISWNDEYLLGIPEVDTQHKYFVTLLNGLYGQIIKMGPETEVRPIIERISDYAKLHFQTEESLLEKYSYPDLEAHKALHVNLGNELAHRISLYRGTNPAVLIELVDFLEDWLISHLNKADRAYANYLKEKGFI